VTVGCGSAWKNCGVKYDQFNPTTTNNNAKLLQMSESQSARRAKAKKAEPVKIEPPKPVTHSWEMLGLEWSGRKVYDPYSMKNRHEGVRT